MDKLLAGYRRFRETGWPVQRRLFESLARDGQTPKALVIACIDSRVDPAMIFDVAPGDILTIRNVANLVPPYAPDVAYHGTSAALEFGVRVLKVPHVIVLGHGMCSGVRALLEGAPENAEDFVAQWMGMAEPALERSRHCPPEERALCCEYEVVKISLANLMTFPWIAGPVASGELCLHGAWFNIRTGRLMTLQPDGNFAVASDQPDSL